MFSHIYITFNTLLLKGIDEFDTDAKNLRRYVTNTFLYVVLHVFDVKMLMRADCFLNFFVLFNNTT